MSDIHQDWSAAGCRS